MDRFLFVAGVIALPAVCTTLGAAGVLLMRRPAGPKVQRMLCGMAAGIMLAASVWSLLLPAIDRAEKMGLPAFLPSALGLVLGAAGLLRLEQTAGQLLAGGPGQGRRMVLAVTLHNLPEGMVVGLAAALAATGQPDAVSGALALSLGVGLQNIPEGAAVSLPLRQAEGRVCSEFVMCYPPGIPILAPGERITPQILDYIEYAKAKGCSMTGPEDPEILRLNVLA